jgi:hypothetical protein
MAKNRSLKVFARVLHSQTSRETCIYSMLSSLLKEDLKEQSKCNGSFDDGIVKPQATQKLIACGSWLKAKTTLLLHSSHR